MLFTLYFQDSCSPSTDFLTLTTIISVPCPHCMNLRRGVAVLERSDAVEADHDSARGAVAVAVHGLGIGTAVQGPRRTQERENFVRRGDIKPDGVVWCWTPGGTEMIQLSNISCIMNICSFYNCVSTDFPAFSDTGYSDIPDTVADLAAPKLMWLE